MGLGLIPTPTVEGPPTLRVVVPIEPTAAEVWRVCVGENHGAAPGVWEAGEGKLGAHALPARRGSAAAERAEGVAMSVAAERMSNSLRLLGRPVKRPLADS